jgi:hypothetical protein
MRCCDQRHILTSLPAGIGPLVLETLAKPWVNLYNQGSGAGCVRIRNTQSIEGASMYPEIMIIFLGTRAYFKLLIRLSA